MSTIVGVKPLSRSAKVGFGAKDLAFGRQIFVNLDNKRVIRDLSRHASIGQFFESNPARFQLDTGTVDQGGSVTPRTASLTLDVSAAYYTALDGTTKGSLAVGTQAVTPDAANPLIAAIGINTSTFATGAIAIATSVAAAAGVTEARTIAFPNSYPLTGLDNTASRIWLALVWVPPTLGSVTGVAATGVFTKAAHGYNVGDPVWFNAVTGATAGLSTGTTYYVNTVPSSSTFTVSTTLGGSTLTWTTDVTAGSVQRQILAADVIDIRP